ncbi:MAG: metallophosphoesterase family protein [Pirellulales bacterium]|nr:metallophosphoesterase family protein [Pirellulales bacterium]
MKLLGITDLHGNRRTLAEILDKAGAVDVVLLGGDITNFGTPREAGELADVAGSLGARVLAVAGNCDSAAIDERLVELGVSVAGRGAIIGNVGFHGIPAMPPWIPHMYHFTEDELAAMLAAGHARIDPAARRRVVLSHAPPRARRVDRTRLWRHVGSTALAEFIDRTQPELVLCGHIHEARGVERMGRTIVVNCGAAAAGSYALVELDPELRVELGRT